MIYEPSLLNGLEMPALIERAQALSPIEQELSALIGRHERLGAKSITMGWKNLARGRVDHVENTCKMRGWDGGDAEPITNQVVRQTRWMLHLLPDGIRPPRIIPSAEGGITLEWNQGRSKVLSLTVFSDQIVYAALLESRTKHYGEEPISNELPRIIREVLSTHFSFS